MKKIKRIIAAVTAVSVIALGSISASATTADDVVAAARSAGILETYVMQLDNFLRANSFNSNQYDMMIEGLGNVRNISIDVIHQYFPDVESVDDFFYGGGSSDDSNTDPTDSGSSDNKNDSKKDNSSKNNTSDKNLTKDEKTIQDMAGQIVDKMSNKQMLDAIDEIIQTGKKVGLDITVEQLGEKSYTMTVKDKDGNVKLVAPIGKLVSTTGVQSPQSDSRFPEVAAVCASVLALGSAGAWLIGKKNRAAEE